MALISAALVAGAATSYLLWSHAAVPQTAEVLAFVGSLGEWEMAGTVERQGNGRELAGPMKLTHVGWCSQDGPLEKQGEVRIRFARLSSSIVATVQFDGGVCDFSGHLSDAYAGVMKCPDRRPTQMRIWVR